jgi:hypothetical protein
MFARSAFVRPRSRRLSERCDSELLLHGSSIEGSDRFCPPRVPPQQAQRVVVLYMEQHPEQLHLDFKVLALRALQQAWPCPKVACVSP